MGRCRFDWQRLGVDFVESVTLSREQCRIDSVGHEGMGSGSGWFLFE